MNNVTELVFILDRSGSMAGLESDTIGGFNAMLEKQKKEPGTAYVSTVLFNNFGCVLHDRLEVQKVPPMTDADYQVGGCTALVDAIGDAIHHIGNIHKYARPEDVPHRTLFVITTDGMENSSHHYDSDTVKRMIERQKAKYGWEFLFLGANIDAVETAQHFGIGADILVWTRHSVMAAPYHRNEQGVLDAFRFLNEPIATARTILAERGISLSMSALILKRAGNSASYWLSR